MANLIHWCVSMKDWNDANRSEANGPTDFEIDPKTSWEKSSSHQDGNPVWTKCDAKPAVRSESEPLADVLSRAWGHYVKWSSTMRRSNQEALRVSKELVASVVGSICNLCPHRTTCKF